MYSAIHYPYAGNRQLGTGLPVMLATDGDTYYLLSMCPNPAGKDHPWLWHVNASGEGCDTQRLPILPTWDWLDTGYMLVMVDGWLFASSAVDSFPIHRGPGEEPPIPHVPEELARTGDITLPGAQQAILAYGAWQEEHSAGILLLAENLADMSITQQ